MLKGAVNRSQFDEVASVDWGIHFFKARGALLENAGPVAGAGAVLASVLPVIHGPAAGTGARARAGAVTGTCAAAGVHTVHHAAVTGA